MDVSWAGEGGGWTLDTFRGYLNNANPPIGESKLG